MKKRLKKILIQIVAKLPFSFQVYALKRYGWKFFWYRAVFNRQEHYSKEKMYHYQCQKLQAQIQHVYQNVPYYQRLFKKLNLTAQDIQRPKDLAKLPVIYRETIKDHYEDFKALDFERYHPTRQTTSGSTGSQFQFFIDRDVIALVDTIGWRRWNWAGMFFNVPHAILRQPLGYRSKKFNVTDYYFYDPITKMLELNTYFLNEEDIKKFFELMNEYKSEVLMIYPSYIPLLINCIKKYNIKTKIRTVISGAEKLYANQRNQLEEVMNVKVYNLYGMEERVVYAAECREGNMHHFFDSGILEILKDGKPCKGGEVGEFVCTGFYNRSMPLIRYTTGDFGYFIEGQCPCGSEMPMIKIVGGRNRDFIISRNRVYSLEPQHTFLKDEHYKIDKIQFYQENIDHVTVKIVTRDRYTDEDTQFLKNRYEELLNHEITVDIEIVDDVKREASGKFRYVLSKVPINANQECVTK